MRFVFAWPPCWSKKHHSSGLYRGSKFMHFDKSCVKMSQNYTSNLDKVFLNVPPSSDFGLEARILQIGWFYRPKWKKVEKSASKNKHPIKLRFLIWRLQSANPEKKVIPENQGFGSCPLIIFFPVKAESAYFLNFIMHEPILLWMLTIYWNSQNRWFFIKT